MNESEKPALNSLGEALEQATRNDKQEEQRMQRKKYDEIKAKTERGEGLEEYEQYFKEKYEEQNQSESSEETPEVDDSDTESQPEKETSENGSADETSESENTDERSSSESAEVNDSESKAIGSRSPEEKPEAGGADTEPREEEKPETEPVVETDVPENTEKGNSEPEVSDGESKEAEAKQEKEDTETAKETVEKHKNLKIFGKRLKDWFTGDGSVSGAVGGLGAGAIVSISTRALMPWTVISGAVGGGLAGMSRVVYKDWHDSERRRQKKTIRSLEKETGAKSKSGEFWETVGNSVGEWEQMLNALNKDIKRNRERIENTDNKKERKELERELIQSQAEAEFLNDRLRYTYAAMAQEEKETKKKKKIDRIDAFVNSYDVKTGGYRKVEGEQRERLLERANKHAQEIQKTDSERRKTLRKRLTQAGLRGAAIGTVTGIVGGYLGALASGAGDSGAEVISGDGSTPDTSTESTDPGGEPETDTPVSESTDSSDIEKGSEDGSEEGGALESEPGGFEEEMGIETALDNLPETIVLESGDNPWSLVEEQLKEYLGKDPTNAEILSVAKAVAEESGISVPEWGIEGGADYRSLPVDHELQFAGNENVQEAIKGLME